jgi:RNA polymerase sigma factor (sigma-70 family)
MYERHGATVLGLCRSLVRNQHDAEDAAQRTFLSAYRSLLNGIEPRHPAAWLATIARNECWRISERRMREPVGDREPVGSLPDPADQAAVRAEFQELWTTIAELPRQQREALLLRELSGMSYTELAGRLHVSEPAVESLLFRARRQLRERLYAVYGSAAACAAPLVALRDALARLLGSLPDPTASGLATPMVAKLAAGAAAVAAVSGTIAAVESPSIPQAVPRADAAVVRPNVDAAAVHRPPAAQPSATGPTRGTVSRVPRTRRKAPHVPVSTAVSESRQADAPVQAPVRQVRPVVPATPPPIEPSPSPAPVEVPPAAAPTPAPPTGAGGDEAGAGGSPVASEPEPSGSADGSGVPGGGDDGGGGTDNSGPGSGEQVSGSVTSGSGGEARRAAARARTRARKVTEVATAGTAGVTRAATTEAGSRRTAARAEATNSRRPVLR